MKRAKKTLVSLAIASMALATIPFNAFASIPFSVQPPSTAVTIERFFGTDRVGTAVAVANDGWTKADTAILS